MKCIAVGSGFYKEADKVSDGHVLYSTKREAVNDLLRKGFRYSKEDGLFLNRDTQEWRRVVSLRPFKKK